MMIKADV